MTTSTPAVEPRAAGALDAAQALLLCADDETAHTVSRVIAAAGYQLQRLAVSEIGSQWRVADLVIVAAPHLAALAAVIHLGDPGFTLSVTARSPPTRGATA